MNKNLNIIKIFKQLHKNGKLLITHLISRVYYITIILDQNAFVLIFHLMIGNHTLQQGLQINKLEFGKFRANF